MMVLKRNSKIIPYISKHHFQLNLTLGRVGKEHSDEDKITGMEELKLSKNLYSKNQNMKAVRINFDNMALTDLWSLTAENSNMKYMRVQNSNL